ncbi:MULTISPECIES: streptophobe family protein [Streptomyces]|uniref:streptophobe family protein n=1 Tax=Streptomyces TaxID=1883 RepID=UPI0004C47B89|nr:MULTISPECIES: streptophobe family protein [Streptomyces]KJY19704.1 membrane protein [Streptomyces sp. NRRL S-104]KOU78911.1 membrane protein [Streptomyces sp. XY58]KOV01116.1 membrane protein [Streptomyces sp. XY37]KOV39929.1 membrane protein [Streptomyces sp. MMG1064]
MVSQTPRPASTGGSARAWRDALVTVVAGFAAMTAVAAAGLACAGAGDLPEGAFPHVLAAVVVMAAGGTVEVSGDAGLLAGVDASLAVLPLSVSLAGALAAGYCFLRPLHNRAVARPRELVGRAVPLVVLWLLALLAAAFLARQDFGISADDPTVAVIGELLDSAPTVGFRADVPATLLFGLLWILGLLLIALLVSRRAPLPAGLVRFHTAVRPAAFATTLLLLSYVVIGVVVALVVAATRGDAGRTLAVVLLGLPNLVWFALTLGFGGAWEARVEGAFGLPMPQLLDEVLRDADGAPVDVASFAARDPRAWWLVVVAAVLLLGTGVLAALRSPAHVRPWQHALHLGAALALATLAVCLLCRVQAEYGLSLLGIGEVDGLGGQLVLNPVLWRTVGLGLLWGAVAGFLGGLLARPLHRRGRVDAPAAAPAHG